MKRLILLVGVLIMSGGVFAEILISEPNAVYNLGDRLYVSLDGLRGSDNGNLNIDLVCNGKSTNLVKISARAFSFEEDQSYSIPYKILDKKDLELVNLSDILGDCQIVSSLGDNVVSSNSFSVTRNVFVTASLDKTIYNPGEEVLVKVEAVRANGNKLNGFVEASGVAFFSKAIENGFVEEVFRIPDTLEAGNYYLNVSAYDVGMDDILNRGFGGIYFGVAQVASSMIMSLDGETAIPGEEFEIGVEVFDQAGVEMDGAILLRILSPDGSGIEAHVSAGEVGDINFDLNSSVGMWKVVAEFNDMVAEREFEMVALQKVEFDIEDSVLSVKNVGNVLYNRTINVDIGEDVRKLELNIGVGEVRKFDIGAPTGEYEVIVDDGESSFSKQVLLTGNAVSVSDLRTVGIFKSYSIIWVFLILILGGIGTVLIIKYRKTRTLGKSGAIEKTLEKFGNTKKSLGQKIFNKVPGNIKPHVENSLNFTNKSPAVQGIDSANYSHKDKTMVDFVSKSNASAESSLVLKGEKIVSSIVSLAIKNYADLGDSARENLQRIVRESKGKGLIDSRGEYIFIVFSPLITRTYKNENLAVKSGLDILEKLNAYNKKFREKIGFGIGVHVGELISSKMGEKLKYTGIGNTISLAKRMSDGDSEKVVVSEDVRKKLMRDLKVEKGKEIGGNLTYIVSEMRDSSGDAARLSELLKRQKSSF